MFTALWFGGRIAGNCVATACTQWCLLVFIVLQWHHFIIVINIQQTELWARWQWLTLFIVLPIHISIVFLVAIFIAQIVVIVDGCLGDTASAHIDKLLRGKQTKQPIAYLSSALAKYSSSIISSVWMAMLVELRTVPHDWQRSDCNELCTCFWWFLCTTDLSERERDTVSSTALDFLLWVRDMQDWLSLCCCFNAIRWSACISDGVRRSGGIHLGRTGCLAAIFSVVDCSKERKLFLFSLRKFLPCVGAVNKP